MNKQLLTTSTSTFYLLINFVVVVVILSSSSIRYRVVMRLNSLWYRQRHWHRMNNASDAIISNGCRFFHSHRSSSELSTLSTHIFVLIENEHVSVEIMFLLTSNKSLAN